MNKFISKKFFIISFLVHITVIMIFFLINFDNKIAKRFLVLGLHSKKPTQAYFKCLKAPSTDATNKWLSQRNIVHPKPKIKKEIPQKKDLQPKKEIPPKEPLKKQTTINHKNKNTYKAKKVLSEKKQNLKIHEKKGTQKEIPPKEIQKTSDQDIKATQDIKAEQNIKDEEELNFNLMGESDPTLAIYQRHIQKEVERLWHPPIGVPKGTECTIMFIINSLGNVENFEFINHSKVLIYDLSISRVAKNFKFDKTLWNKKFTIDFRQ